MTSSDEQKIQEYEDLIKKYGPKKAAEIMRKEGALYDEDFTTEHRKNPIFSNENTKQLATPTEKIMRRLAMQQITVIPLHLKQFGTQSKNAFTIPVGSDTEIFGTSYIVGELLSPEDYLTSSTTVEEINLNSTEPIQSMV
jgi:hypothetical protein